MQQPTQIFPSTYRSGSDVFASREKAAYRIGRPDGASMACFNVSEREAHEIVTNLPDELLEKVKEHYKLVPFGTIIVDSQIPKNVAVLVGEGSQFQAVAADPVEIPEEPEFIDPADDWLEPIPLVEDIDSIHEGTEDEEEPEVDLKTLNLSELKDLAKELNIVGVSRYTADQKDELINLIDEELKKIDDVNDEDGL